MRLLATAIAATAVLSAAGCADRPATLTPAAAPSTARVIDVSVLHFAVLNYFGAKTPAENARERWSAVIVSGTVAGFAPGRAHQSAGGGSLLHKIVLRVKIDQKLKGADAYTADGHVYVEMWGNSTAGLARFERAIPRGTPVVVFGGDRLMADGPGVRGAGNGHPAGTALLSGMHPQSVFFEGVPATAGTSTSGRGATAEVIPAQESLEDFGPEWAKIRTLDDLIAAARAGLNGN
ncbi:hypothetical protein ACQEU3_42470 [Spirillospora sp. CA-253888]